VGFPIDSRTQSGSFQVGCHVFVPSGLRRVRPRAAFAMSQTTGRVNNGDKDTSLPFWSAVGGLRGGSIFNGGAGRACAPSRTESAFRSPGRRYKWRLCGAPGLTAGLTGKLVCRLPAAEEQGQANFSPSYSSAISASPALSMNQLRLATESARLLGRVKFGNDGRPFIVPSIFVGVALHSPSQSRSVLTVAAPGVCIVPTSWTEGRGVWGVPSG